MIPRTSAPERPVIVAEAATIAQKTPLPISKHIGMQIADETKIFRLIGRVVPPVNLGSERKSAVFLAT
jgi:hypothetical protein